MPKRSSRPRDANQLAKSIVDSRPGRHHLGGRTTERTRRLEGREGASGEPVQEGPERDREEGGDGPLEEQNAKAELVPWKRNNLNGTVVS